MQHIARFIVKHWYWIPVWVLAVLIVGFVAIRMQSYFPLGSEQFIYPLRTLSDRWWHVAAQVVGLVARICFIITPLAAITWIGWLVLTDLYPYNTQLDHAAALLRVYAVYFVAALVGMFFVSPTPVTPQRLDTLSTTQKQYVLEMRTTYSLDTVYLYECDPGGILCLTIFRQTAWNVDARDFHLRMNSESVYVMDGETVRFEQRYIDAS